MHGCAFLTYQQSTLVGKTISHLFFQDLDTIGIALRPCFARWCVSASHPLACHTDVLESFDPTPVVQTMFSQFPITQWINRQSPSLSTHCCARHLSSICCMENVLDNTHGSQCSQHYGSVSYTTPSRQSPSFIISLPLSFHAGCQHCNSASHLGV